jgi:hypothetical protein
MWRGVYAIGALVGIGLGTWVVIIIVNAARKRMQVINERKRRSIK